MKKLGLFFLLGLLVTTARAKMGDSVAQTLSRYGQPVATSSQPGDHTSTRTFSVSGIMLTCGYVDGKVAMETYVRTDRNFLAPENEAILRTEGRKIAWKPSGGFRNGTYTRPDGITATIKDNKVRIVAPSWTQAVAQDAATRNAKAAGASTNGAPVDTNSAPSAATTTNAPDSSANVPNAAYDTPKPAHAGVVVTNTAP